MSKKSAKTKFLTWMYVVVPLGLGHIRQLMINLWCRLAWPAVECFELVHCVNCWGRDLNIGHCGSSAYVNNDPVGWVVASSLNSH